MDVETLRDIVRELIKILKENGEAEIDRLEALEALLEPPGGPE